MCDFIVDFWMYGIFMWFLGYVLSLASIVLGLKMVLALLFYFLDNHVGVGFPLDCFLIGDHNSLWLRVGTNTLESLEQIG